MRKLPTVGTLILGVFFGAGGVALSSQIDAPAKGLPTQQPDARFVVDKEERGVDTKQAQATLWFRLIKDRKTGDCFLAHRTIATDFVSLVKTDDDACAGF